MSCLLGIYQLFYDFFSSTVESIDSVETGSYFEGFLFFSFLYIGVTIDFIFRSDIVPFIMEVFTMTVM